MRRLLPFILVFVFGCGLLPGRSAAPSPAATNVATGAAPATAASATSRHVTAVAATGVGTTTPGSAASPAISVTPAPRSSATPAPLSPTASPYQLSAGDVHFEPDPQLYDGDIASIIVVGKGLSTTWQGVHTKLYVNGLNAPPLAQADFAPYGLGNQWQATYTWAWDTRGRAGQQNIFVEVDPPADKSAQPISQTLSVPVSILPASARPAPEPEAKWASAESNCCVFHYLTNTAAARDIDLIRATADAALAHDVAVLGVKRQDKITFTMLSRLLGNGGFTANEVSITYVDRNPAASSLFTIFAHEGTHVLDRQIARTRPTIMTEGLAVYVAGGHFKTEPLEARAAALLALNRAIPLSALANNFYLSQHEIGYLEAGAFIQYLVDQYGWARFRAMYGAFQSAPSDAQILDAGLQAQYGQSLSALEANWLDYLKGLPANPAEVSDLRLTIDLFDTVRRYQQLDDPSAYFLTAWLPDGTEARKRDIIADFIRHPDGPDNIALETMFVEAGQALNAGAFERASALLAGANAALDAGSLEASSLAAEHLAVALRVLGDGYEPQRITLGQDKATVEAISHWPRLDELTLVRGAGGWHVLATASMATASMATASMATASMATASMATASMAAASMAAASMAAANIVPKRNSDASGVEWRLMA